MKRRSLFVVLACVGAGPPLAFAALFIAGRFGPQALQDFFVAVLGWPWFWLPDTRNEGLVWFLIIGGSGVLYGLLAGLLLANRLYPRR